MSSKLSNIILDNFVDELSYKLADHISPVAYKFNITPNQITILGIITGLAGCYYLYIDNLYLSFLLIMISFFLDCLDGHHARKYKLTSEFGDLLDHIGDIIKTTTLIYILYIKYFSDFYNIKELIVFILVINFIHNSCTYELLDKDNKIFKRKFCIYPKTYIKSALNITKYLSNGILLIYLYIYIYII